jgi:hypothetical protein
MDQQPIFPKIPKEKRKPRKVKGPTPSVALKKELVSKGYIVDTVEKWNPFAGIRQDLFGFIDLVSVHPENNIIQFIQITSKSNISARVNKIKSHSNINVAKAISRGSNTRLLVIGYDKVKKDFTTVDMADEL